MGKRTGKGIIQRRLKNATAGEIAAQLGVHPAHIYNVEQRGVSPTLYEAIVTAGWIDAPEPTYTLAFRFRDRADFERIRAIVDAHPDGRAAWLVEAAEQAG